MKNSFYTKELMDMQKSTMFPSKVYDNCFSEEEFGKLLEFCGNSKTLEPTIHAQQSYTKFDYYNSNIFSLLNDKVYNVIGEHYVYLSVIHDTQGNPVLIHTDHNLADVRKESIPYATICIPLEVQSKNCDWGFASTVTFDQIYFPEQDWEDRKHFFTGFLKPKDIPNVQGLHNNHYIDKKMFETYLSQHSYDFMEGLSIESINEWKKYSLIVWHQCRFHCSSNYYMQGSQNKKSIVLWTTTNKTG